MRDARRHVAHSSYRRREDLILFRRMVVALIIVGSKGIHTHAHLRTHGVDLIVNIPYRTVERAGNFRNSAAEAAILETTQEALIAASGSE